MKMSTFNSKSGISTTELQGTLILKVNPMEL
jgi:hypothetical protein